MAEIRHSETRAEPSPHFSGAGRLFSAFFLSGASGLIYEVLWVRMLTRYLGSTTPATSTVLCVFMGGLASGAYLGGRLADRSKNPIRLYAWLELGIALSAFVSSFAVINGMGGVYVGLYRFFGVDPLYQMSARVLFSASCLFVPTALMGATLPLLMTFAKRHRLSFQHLLGRLYAINTFGALCGVLAAGFILIGALGETSTLLTAGLLNLLAAGFVLHLDRETKSAQTDMDLSRVEDSRLVAEPYPRKIRSWSRVALFFSGFAALAGEVLWTRLLMLPLKTSIYAFSAMLALFLLGIAMGSWLSSRTPVSSRRPVAVFAFLEMSLGIMTLLGLLAYSALGRLSDGFSSGLLVNGVTAICMILPVAVAFGWQFPVAVRCADSDADQPGRENGWAYAANTLGSICGSILSGFLFIPLFGVTRTLVLLAGLNVSLGLVLMVITPRDQRGRLPQVGVAMAVAFAVLALWVGEPYRLLMEEKARYYLGPNAVVYEVFEGVAGTTVPAGSTKDRYARHLFIDGVGMTVLTSETKLMAHLPMALVPEPKDVLVICFGMGTTVRSATRFPITPERIDAVDIVPRVFDCFQYYHDDASSVLAHPSIRLFAEDGRNFLLVRKDRYDVITIDPAPPIYSAGTVNLYSREFLSLCKSRIRDDGVVCLWLPTGPPKELMMVMKTFLNVFPGASLWGGLSTPGFFLIGGHRSFAMDSKQVMELAQRLAAIADLHEWKSMFADPDTLRELYLMGPETLSMILGDSPEISDDHPYTEFPLWRGGMARNVEELTANRVRRYLNLRGRQ